MKNKFTFFDNFKETADKLPDDLRLKFYDAMTDYVFKDVNSDDVVVSALIMAIKPYLDNEVSSWGGAREGSGRKRKNQDKSNEIKFNQVKLEKLEKNQNTLEKVENNQDKSSLIKNNQDLQKTKEKTPPHPQENKNKNIYPPVTPNGVYSPLPEKDDSGMMDIEELIAATPPKKRFVPPKLDDINAYIAEKGLIVNGQVFLDYFTTGNWKDSEGKPVKNWKQKLITWNERDRRKRTIDAARSLLKTGVTSGTYGKDAPL